MEHINIIVSGRVHGVWFRDSARKKALELNISGFVENKSDGTVYLEAEGNEEDLDALVDWCKQGPPLAKVKNVEVSKGEKVNFTGFEIRR